MRKQVPFWSGVGSAFQHPDSSCLQLILKKIWQRLDIAVGMELRISVLFSTKFAFPSLGVLTEIIGKDGRREEEIGYQWRIRLTRLGDGDHLKARYLLKGIQWRRLTRNRLQTVLFGDWKRNKPTFAG